MVLDASLRLTLKHRFEGVPEIASRQAFRPLVERGWRAFRALGDEMRPLFERAASEDTAGPSTTQPG